MQNIIAWVAIVCGIACFVVYVVLTLKLIPDPRDKTNKAVEQLTASKQGFAGASAKDFAELVKAVASLVDSLVKAGPALWSLIGSMLFLVIAALAAGVFS